MGENQILSDYCTSELSIDQGLLYQRVYLDTRKLLLVLLGIELSAVPIYFTLQFCKI